MRIEGRTGHTFRNWNVGLEGVKGQVTITMTTQGRDLIVDGGVKGTLKCLVLRSTGESIVSSPPSSPLVWTSVV